MRYVKLTKEQSKKISITKKGLTSGKRDKKTGLRPSIVFCSSLDFSIEFGSDAKREFITI